MAPSTLTPTNNAFNANVGETKGRRPQAKLEVWAALERLERRVEAEAWTHKSGRTDRSIVIALLRRAARDHEDGTPEHLRASQIPAGLRVVYALRPLSLEAGCSLSTVQTGIGRLKQRGILRQDNGMRRDGEPGAFVLLDREDAEPEPATDHETGTRRAHPVQQKPKDSRDSTLSRSSFQVVPDVRGGSARISGTGACIPLRGARAALRWGPQRLGKTAEQVLDFMRSKRIAHIKELEAYTSSRARDLRRRTLARLEGAGVLEQDDSGDVYSLHSSCWSHLQLERGLTGELEAARLQAERFEHDREGYQNRHKNKPDRAPSRAEMDAARAQREREAADSAVSELQPVREPEPQEVAPASAGAYIGSEEPLEEADAQVLRVVEAYEWETGKRFAWSWGSFKPIFYNFGLWPEPEEVPRLRELYHRMHDDKGFDRKAAG